MLEINKSFKEFINNKDKYAILYGGAGSGKSYATAQKILIRVLTERNHKFLVLRKVARTLRDSVFALLKDEIVTAKIGNKFKINETNMSIKVLSNGNEIILRGLDDKEKIKSVHNITGIWMEEASDFTQDDFDQLELRIRGRLENYIQIVLTFNPISIHHWLKKMFFDKKVEGSYISKTTYLDNPFAGEAYHKVMERLKIDNPSYYKIYALGNWGVLKGIIYSNYKIIDELPEYYEDRFYGLDFGFNHPFAIVETRVDGRNIYIDEVYYKIEKTNEEVIKEVELDKKIRLFPDGARPDLIKKWKEKGYNIQTANKTVFDGINTVGGFNIHITRRSINLIKEINLYSWRESKDGEMLDEPIKLNDDGMDAIRYSLTPYISKRGKTKSFKVSI